MPVLSFADWIRLLIDIVSLIIILGMAIYAARLLLAMRGILEKSWRYISIGSIFLAFGVSSFALEAVFAYSAFLYALQYIGGVLMISGGTSILLGLRSQYKIWVPKKVIQRENEKIRDLS
ncbi:MAG: hypothetical protein ACYC7D_01135 [Nitrososphaerales archaeon]